MARRLLRRTCGGGDGARRRASGSVVAHASLLTRVARDESEHATLAWDVVRFALKRRGAEVATAIARAIRERVVRRALARRDRLLHPE